MAIKMGFVKRRCQAEEACVTAGRKSTDPVFRYHSVARFGVIDRRTFDVRSRLGTTLCACNPQLVSGYIILISTH